VVYCDRVA